jgi:hypothetical protein
MAWAAKSAPNKKTIHIRVRADPESLESTSLDVAPGGLRFVEPRLQPPVRFEEQLILANVSLVPFSVRLHGGYLMGESLRDVEAVEDADPADDGLCWS